MGNDEVGNGDTASWRRVVGGTQEGVGVGEEHAEVGAEGFDEVKLGGRGEAWEVPHEGVYAVEDILLLNAEELLIG